MRRVWLTSSIVVLIGFQLVCSGAQAHEPKGIYTIFLYAPTVQKAQMVAYGNTTLPDYPNPKEKTDPTDAVLVNYFCALLNDTAVSGLAPLIGWVDLEPTKPPAVPTWNYLNDVFQAVNNWNSGTCPNQTALSTTPKTVQLIIAPGIQSPPWLFDELSSCDGLFMPSRPKVGRDCGQTSLFLEGENATPSQMPLPMPWNSTYKAAWKAFLVKLRKQIHRDDPTGKVFVSIDVAGPTSASTEMILPFQGNQPAVLTLPNGEATIRNLDVATAWNDLFDNHYGAKSQYPNSDLAFVDEWNAAIDMFGEVFSGVTLVLEATADSLPDFPPANASLTTPAPGFDEDCSGSPPGANADPPCAAVTQVLYHFVNPFVGGKNSKETQEAGLRASQDFVNLGMWGVQWLAADTYGGGTPLLSTRGLPSPGDISQMLAGLQFGKAISDGSDAAQAEGCAQLAGGCSGLTPEQLLYNVLAHYFDGTFYGPTYASNPPLSGSDSVDLAGTNLNGGSPNFNYANAPMNVLQVWDADVLYADGLANCRTDQITGHPGASPTPVPPDVSACQQVPMPTLGSDGPTAQQMLNTALEQILGLVAQQPPVTPPSAPGRTPVPVPTPIPCSAVSSPGVSKCM